MTVSGERVLLRPLEPRDVDALVALRDASESSFGAVGDEAREKLQRQVERAATLETDGTYTLAVDVGGELGGDVQARAPTGGFPPGVCEIGIALVPAARGRAVGREAVALFTGHLHAGGWPRVQASTHVENEPMRRVLERCGYALEGVLRSYAPGADGSRRDYAMFASTAGGQNG